jgi:hypothetical protein
VAGCPAVLLLKLSVVTLGARDDPERPRAAHEAHRIMEGNRADGKIVVLIDEKDSAFNRHGAGRLREAPPRTRGQSSRMRRK